MTDQLVDLKAKDPNDPRIPALEKKIEARKEIIATGKYAEPVVQAKIAKDAEAAWNSMSRVEKRSWARDQGVDITEAKEKFIQGYTTGAKPQKPAAPAPGTKPKDTSKDYSNLWTQPTK